MQKEKSLATIILAAGNSSRLKRPKQLLVWQGESLLQRAVRLASEAIGEEIVVVYGAFKSQIEDHLEQLPVAAIYHEHWQEGMGSSLQKGLKALKRASYEGFLIMVCDQPFLTTQHLTTLKESFHTKNTIAVASSYMGSFGVPAILASHLLNPDSLGKKAQGAKQILKNLSPSQLSLIPFPKGEIDIDTEEDWENLQIC